MGSPAGAMTIGIVLVALCNASAAGVWNATSTSGLSPARSTACAPTRSLLPSAQRDSTTKLFPSTWASSLSPDSSASTQLEVLAADDRPGNPILAVLGD